MKRKPILLILTDSISLPRSYESGHVEWEETYISRLKDVLNEFEIISIAIGGASIKELRNQVVYYSVLSPKYVIIQCGIVDCTPRAFGKIEIEIVKKLRLLRLTRPFVKLLRKYRSHKYVSPKKFEHYLKEMKMKLNAEIFFSLSILPSNDAYERKAPGITRNINTYNTILERNTNFINLSAIPKEAILSDHHHINALGHDYIFNCILEEVK